MSEFVMGARLQLRDMFSPGLSSATRASMLFRSAVMGADQATTQFRNGSSRARDEMGRYVRVSRDAELRTRAWVTSNGKLGASFSMVKTGIMGLVGTFGLIKAKNWLVDSNADMETYKNTLKVVLGDEKKAVDTMAWAQKFSAQTPFEIPQIVEATTRLQSYGITASKVMTPIGNMASVMGKDIMQAVEAVADAQTGELERLKEFGITKQQLMDQAAKMGLKPVNNKGQITDQKGLNAALFALMDQRFKGGMELQSKTFKGMLSNVQDYIGTMGRKLGAPIFEKLKEGMGKALDFMNKLQESGALDRFIGKVQTVGGIVFGVFGRIAGFVRDVIMMIIHRFTLFYSQNKPKIDAIRTAVVTAFTTIWQYAQPILAWLKDTALPGIVNILAIVGGYILDIANFFIKNWSTIGPIVMGIGAALLAYQAYITAVSVATKIWAAVQAVLNGVMAINPVYLIVIAIGVLIGLIYLAWTRCETFRNIVTAVFKAVAGVAMAVFNAIKNVVMTVFNFIKPFVSVVFTVLKTVFMVYFTIVKVYLTVLFTIFKVIFNVIKTVVMVVFTILKTIFMVWFTLVKIYLTILFTIFKVIFNVIRAVVAVVFNILKAIFMTYFNVVTTVLNVIVNVFRTIFDTIWNIVKTVIDFICKAFEGMGKFISNIWEGIVGVVKGVINTIIGAVNAIIRGVNSIKVSIPDWIPFIGGKTFGLSLPEIPAFAKGTDFAPGGPARVNEKGGEIIDLPKGSRVIPADKSQQLMDQLKAKQPTTTITIEKLVEKIIIQGGDKSAHEIAQEVIKILKDLLQKADEIAGNADMGVLL